jgi:hypothetical protein
MPMSTRTGTGTRESADSRPEAAGGAAGETTPKGEGSDGDIETGRGRDRSLGPELGADPNEASLGPPRWLVALI